MVCALPTSFWLRFSRLSKTKASWFLKKDSSLSPWLSEAPDWGLPELEGLEFNVFAPKAIGVKQLKR